MTVTDNGTTNCSKVYDFELATISNIQAQIEIETSVSCYAYEDGSVNIMPSGGTAPFDYNWSSNILNFIDARAFNLPAGFYSVTITDYNLCNYEISFEVEQPDSLELTFDLEHIECFAGLTGSIQAFASGGNGGYTYSWDNGLQGDVIQNLEQGWYTLTVYDSKGCEIKESVHIDEPDEDIEIELIAFDIGCNAIQDGRIDVFVQNAISPVQYSLDGINFQANNSFDKLDAGVYDVFIVDARDCQKKATIEITQIPNLLVDAGEDVLVEFGGDVTLSANASLHTGVIEWKWESSNISNFSCLGCSSPEVMNIIKSFSAKVIATDENGCTGEDFININIYEKDIIYIPKGFSSNGDFVNDVLHVYGNPNIKVLSFKVYSRWGELLYHASDFFAGDETKGWNGLVGSQMANQGTYVWTAKYQHLSGKIDFGRGQTILLK